MKKTINKKSEKQAKTEQKKQETYIQVCPKCHSKEITHRGMIGNEAYSNAYVCLSCGFQSPVFPEMLLSDAEKIPDKPKEFISSRLPAFSDYSNMWRGIYSFYVFLAAPLIIIREVFLLFYKLISPLYFIGVIAILVILYFFIKKQRDRTDKDYKIKIKGNQEKIQKPL